MQFYYVCCVSRIDEGCSGIFPFHCVPEFCYLGDTIGSGSGVEEAARDVLGLSD